MNAVATRAECRPGLIDQRNAFCAVGKWGIFFPYKVYVASTGYNISHSGPLPIRAAGAPVPDQNQIGTDSARHHELQVRMTFDAIFSSPMRTARGVRFRPPCQPGEPRRRRRSPYGTGLLVTDDPTTFKRYSQRHAALSSTRR